MSKHSLRLQGDDQGDELFSSLKDNRELYKSFLSLNTNEELIAFVKVNPLFSFFDTDLSRFSEYSQGHIFFEKYTEPILTILGLYSLPYCYAGANGARVLIQSKKIVEQPKERLMETAKFVFDVCDRNAFSLEGSGLVSILKVRLMHAAARYYAAKSITDETPVNQEDMLGTLLSFSLLVLRGLRTLGVDSDENLNTAYFGLWNEIGYSMGIRKENLPTSIKSASLLERQIRRREFKRSEEGVILTASLLKYLNTFVDQMKGFKPVELMTLFLGNEVAQCLDLPKASDSKLEILKTGLRSQNFFKDFSITHYKSLLTEFQNNLNKENVDPKFEMALE